MSSKCVTLTKVLVNSINTTVFPWPVSVVPTTPDRLDTVLTAKAFVVPYTAREDSEELGVAVSPLTIQQSEIRDTCNRLWTYELDVAIYQQLTTNDLNDQQPATLGELDKLLEFAESMRDFIDQYRIQDNSTLREMEMSVMNEQMITTSQFFLSSIRPVYLG